MMFIRIIEKKKPPGNNYYRWKKNRKENAIKSIYGKFNRKNDRNFLHMRYWMWNEQKLIQFDEMRKVDAREIGTEMQ